MKVFEDAYWLMFYEDDGVFLWLAVGDSLSASPVCDTSRSPLFCLPKQWPFGTVNKAVPSAASCFLEAGVAAVLSAGVCFLQV